MRNEYALFVVRVSLALIFLYFGVYDKFIHPTNTISIIENVDSIPFSIVRTTMDLHLFVILLGIYETIIGIMLLLGIATRVAAVLGLVSVSGIVWSIPTIYHATVIGALIALIMSGSQTLLSISLKRKKEERA